MVAIAREIVDFYAMDGDDEIRFCVCTKMSVNIILLILFILYILWNATRMDPSSDQASEQL